MANTILSEETFYEGTPCWIWIGKRGNGRSREYGTMNIIKNGKHTSVAAHRFSYEAFIEPIEDGMVVDHLCYQTLCCNPSHLQLKTQYENLMRRRSNGKK